MSKQFTALVLGLILAAICLPLAAQTYSLQSFNYTNTSYMEAHGINNRGAVVGFVRYSDPTSGKSSDLGFKRDANGVLERPFAASRSTYAYGITDHGVIAGFRSTGPSSWTGFLLYQGVFTDYSAQSGWTTLIYGINNRGDFVGVARNGQSSYGFINSNGVATKIQCPPNYSTYLIEPRGIAADGTVVGFCYAQGDVVGFIRGPAGRYKIIRINGSQNTRVLGINSLAHKIVGGYYGYTSGSHGFVYDYITDTTTTVDWRPLNTQVTGINSEGVIVGSAWASRYGIAFIGTPQ